VIGFIVIVIGFVPEGVVFVMIDWTAPLLEQPLR